MTEPPTTSAVEVRTRVILAFAEELYCFSRIGSGLRKKRASQDMVAFASTCRWTTIWNYPLTIYEALSEATKFQHSYRNHELCCLNATRFLS